MNDFKRTLSDLPMMQKAVKNVVTKQKPLFGPAPPLAEDPEEEMELIGDKSSVRKKNAMCEDCGELMDECVCQTKPLVQKACSVKVVVEVKA